MASRLSRAGVKYFVPPTIRLRASSSNAQPVKTTEGNKVSKADHKLDVNKNPKNIQTQAQADEAMRQAMENLAGEGGEHGAELEDGKPVAMKRAVKENMFRYI